MFVILALATALTGTAPAWGATAVKTFVAARFVHAVAFLTAPPQPIRALAFLTGALSTAALAIHSLKKK